MEIDEEIKELKSKIDELKREKEKIEEKIRMSKLDFLTIKIAEILHEKLCHLNHTDMCSWYYGEWSDEVMNYAKEEYYKKAKELIKFLDNCSINSPDFVVSFVKNFLNIIEK